ncbi:hypothetical protein FTUN_1094 [Frigoriglobus tundricola]|uniref:Uncharacterized protein n=1 Tax=Frigoriglobus tundricola TaxID=2774151 RepID=A0A6M5YHR4_9BACT|nr:hypothetical protein FTUN_1094 [Frigoriglobus tundricola]
MNSLATLVNRVLFAEWLEADAMPPRESPLGGKTLTKAV